MIGRMIAAPKPSPWGEGGSPDGLTDEGHTAVGEECRKKGGAQHRPYGLDEPPTSNREIATAAAQPRNDRSVEGRNDRKNWGRDDRKNDCRTKTFPLGGRWQPGWADG